MLHLKLISAHDLSKKNITSYIEVIPKIEGAPNENFYAYAVTERVSKDTDPQFNKDILIPFYCFNTIQLIFYEKKLVGERSIARVTIPLNLGTFLKPQPITDNIELYYPFNGANATVTYSISYSPPTSILTQKFINPMNVYAYLTYDPPLQLNVQEVRLFCKGIDNKGLIFDPSTDCHIRIEEEATRCGPSGLTQVFYFDHSRLTSGRFFFYIKSMNYTGKVTLNFATSPQIVDKENVHEYFCNDNGSPIVVNGFNGAQNTFALFPVALLLRQDDVSIKQISVADSEGIQNVQPVQGAQGTQSQHDYYASHPEGVAQQKIFNAAVKAIHGSLPASSNNGSASAKIRNDVLPGNSHSLKNALIVNSIDKPPKRIALNLQWSSAVSPTFDVYTCSEGFERNSPIIFYDRHDIKAKVFFDYYDDSSQTRERIFFCLDRIEPFVKYISLCARAERRPAQKGTRRIVRQNWSDARCIVTDAESKVELMRFNLPTHDSPCGVFIAMFIRGHDDDWKLMPVCKVIESKNPYKYPPMSCIDSRDAFKELVLSGTAK